MRANRRETGGKKSWCTMFVRASRQFFFCFFFFAREPVIAWSRSWSRSWIFVFSRKCQKFFFAARKIVQNVMFQGLLLERNVNVKKISFATREIMQNLVFQGLLCWKERNVKKISFATREIMQSIVFKGLLYVKIFVFCVLIAICDEKKILTLRSSQESNPLNIIFCIILRVTKEKFWHWVPFKKATLWTLYFALFCA